MFSLIPSDANDPQGLMRRLEPNKQTNYALVYIGQVHQGHIKIVTVIAAFFERHLEVTRL